MKRILYRIIAFCLCIGVWLGNSLTISAQVEIQSPSAILVEAHTGEVIFEKNPDEIRSPASITKIMTMLLTFEAIKDGKVALTDEVYTSSYAASMGGSQVFLEEGEVQTLDTLLKCIAVASGNDASVAVAEHIAGSEEAFVTLMNERAAELGMTNTHFEDCCGLTNSDNHYTTARDVATMSRELITAHPEVQEYSQIWSEDITHVTRRGEEIFTLNSTNKLLKQYPYTTGLKTGSTDKAKYCFSATAHKDGLDLVAVIMGAPDYKIRFAEAQSLLSYGFANVTFYQDTKMPQLPVMTVERGKEDAVNLTYDCDFTYLDKQGRDLSALRKELILPENVEAPIEQGAEIGRLVYFLGQEPIGEVLIRSASAVEEAVFTDYLKEALDYFLL